MIFPLMAVIAMTAPGLASAQDRGVPLDGIAAVVEDEVVLRSELERRVEQVRADILRSGGQMPPDEFFRRQVLDQLIVERLQLQRARSAGISVSEDMLNQAMNSIARNNDMSLAEFTRAVEADGLDFADIRESVRKDMIVNQLRQREVIENVHVSQREVEAFLASQDARTLDDREYRVHHILLRTGSTVDAEETDRVRALAEDLVRRARDGADFTELAYAHSQGQQALQGGDLGWRKLTQLPTVFAERLVSMRVGDVADVVRTAGAFHVIKLSDVRGERERLVIQQTRVRHILIRTTPMLTPERAEARLAELRRRIMDGGSFEDIARRNSEDPSSAVNGGELGWIAPGDTVGPFEDTMNSLEPGEISEPFMTRFGWHILQVLERREHDGTDDMRVAQARRILHERKTEEQTELWVRRLLEEAYVEKRLEG